MNPHSLKSAHIFHSLRHFASQKIVAQVCAKISNDIMKFSMIASRI